MLSREDSILISILWIFRFNIVLCRRSKLLVPLSQSSADQKVRSTLGTLVAAIVQVVALLSYLAAYFPGGITTLRFGGQMLLRGAGNVLPI